LGGALVHLYLGLSANTSGMSPEGNDIFVLKNIFQVFNGFLEFQSFDCISSFESVLEMNSDIISSCFGSCSGGVRRAGGQETYL